jgi:hypothetical protein
MFKRNGKLSFRDLRNVDFMKHAKWVPCHHGMYRAGSLETVARELGKYKLDLLGVQEVRWEKAGIERAEDYTFFFGKRNEDHRLWIGFIVHKRIISAVRRVEFVSDRMSSAI